MEMRKAFVTVNEMKSKNPTFRIHFINKLIILEAKNHNEQL